MTRPATADQVHALHERIARVEHSESEHHDAMLGYIHRLQEALSEHDAAVRREVVSLLAQFERERRLP